MVGLICPENKKSLLAAKIKYFAVTFLICVFSFSVNAQETIQKESYISRSGKVVYVGVQKSNLKEEYDPRNDMITVIDAIDVVLDKDKTELEGLDRAFRQFHIDSVKGAAVDPREAISLGKQKTELANEFTRFNRERKGLFASLEYLDTTERFQDRSLESIKKQLLAKPGEDPLLPNGGVRYRLFDLNIEREALIENLKSFATPESRIKHQQEVLDLQKSLAGATLKIDGLLAKERALNRLLQIRGRGIRDVDYTKEAEHIIQNVIDNSSRYVNFMSYLLENRPGALESLEPGIMERFRNEGILEQPLSRRSVEKPRVMRPLLRGK